MALGAMVPDRKLAIGRARKGLLVSVNGGSLRPGVVVPRHSRFSYSRCNRSSSCEKSPAEKPRMSR
jgi:hypothetical protein